MAAAAEGRVNASTLAKGYVIAVERDGNHLVSTRRKTGVLHATVTDKTRVAGDRQARYVIHTDQGDTLPVPGIQTYSLIKTAGEDRAEREGSAARAGAGSLDGCQLPHLYTVHSNALGKYEYIGPDRSAAIASAREAGSGIGLVWLSAEHDGSQWCRAETSATSLAAGLPDDYAPIACGCGAVTLPGDLADDDRCPQCHTVVTAVDETPTPPISWAEYDSAREFYLAGDQDPPARDDMRPRTETFRGRRLKVTRGQSWGTIDMFVNGASAGSTTGNSAAAMNRAAEHLRKDVLAADERRVTDPDAYPAVWFHGATELAPSIVAYARYRAEQDKRDRAAIAATTCTDAEHVPSVIGCPLGMLDCNGVPFGADTMTVHEVTNPRVGFDQVAADFRRVLAGMLPDVGPVSTGETPWDHQRIRRASVWQLPAGGHLVTVVHYSARTPLNPDGSYAAVLIDGAPVATEINARQPSDALSRFLAWTVSTAIRERAETASPAVDAPAPAVEGADQGDDKCPGCPAHISDPHEPGCLEDTDPVTLDDVPSPAEVAAELAGDQGEAPAVPTVEGVPAGMPYVVTMPQGWPVAAERIDAKTVAKILRTEFLPAWFPGVKFSVRTDRGSMYVGADISWTDGPAAQLVALVAEMWRGKFYDGQHETTSYRGAVLYVNADGVATAYDLPGISINTHRDVSRAAIDKAAQFLRDVPTDTIRAHSGYTDPFGRPWFGGSVDDCARWLAEYGVDRDTRDVRGYAPVDRDVCPVGQCALAKGHRWPALHRNDYGRAFLALPDQGDGDQGDGGTPTAPGPDDSPAPAPAAPTFRTWAELADHIRPSRVHALTGDQGDAPAAGAPVRDLVVVNNGRSALRVHRPGCRDIEREAAGGGTWWNVSSPDVRGVVVDVYGNGDFEGFELARWQDWAGDVQVMPCVGALPDESDAAAPAPAVEGADQDDQVPAGSDAVEAAPVIQPELGDSVRVAGWSGVLAYVAAVQQDAVTGWDTDQTLRFPVGKVTEVTTETLTAMRGIAAQILESPARGLPEVANPMRAILETPTWSTGKPKAGEGVYAVALHDTDGKRLENVELIARVVTDLGCGCYRIECYRPGPVKGDRAWVALRTGCHRHEVQVAVPLPTADELAAAELAGREAYELNIPADRFSTSDERIAPTFKRLPVGSAVYSALITAYHEGYEQAAARAVESADYAARVAEQNARDGAEIAERNPAAQECADINARGAGSAIVEAVARAGELAKVRQLGEPGETDPAARWKLLGLVSHCATTDEARARWARYVAAIRRVHGLPEDVSYNDIIVARKADPRSWADKSAAYWEAYAALMTEEGAERTASAEPHPAPAVEATAGNDQGDTSQGDDDQGDDDDRPEFYTLTVAEYAPELPSDDGDDVITVSHDHEHGTVLDGSVKGDGVYEIAKRHGFTFRPSVGIFIMGSRDKFANLRNLGQLGEALRAAGHKVAFEIDDVWRPAAVRAEARSERVSARVERLAARAARKTGEGDARYEAARSISDGMPFGEPIKIGHHSEGRHRRAFDRIDANYRAAWGAYDYARSLAGRAEGAAANEDAKHGPRAMMRRSERVAADVRRFERELAELLGSDPGNRSPYRRRLLLEIERGREEIAFIAAQLGDKAASGEFVSWSRADFVKGDFANIGGSWCKVIRANAKTVSVENRFGWGGAGTAPYDKVFGRRRDGMQWDSPNGEAWPVADAMKVAWWHEVGRNTNPGDSDGLARLANHGRALRLVLGLAKDAGTAEVEAYGEPTDRIGKRRRALAAWDVYERLTAGETFEQIAATLEPLGDSTPRWVMPAGEPTEVKVCDLAVGDIVVGIYDMGFAGSRPRLIYSMQGPVTGKPETRDRRESGEWTTVEVDGDSHEAKSFRLVLAHVGAGRR